MLSRIGDSPDTARSQPEREGPRSASFLSFHDFAELVQLAPTEETLWKNSLAFLGTGRKNGREALLAVPVLGGSSCATRLISRLFPIGTVSVNRARAELLEKVRAFSGRWRMPPPGGPAPRCLVTAWDE